MKKFWIPVFLAICVLKKNIFLFLLLGNYVFFSIYNLHGQNIRHEPRIPVVKNSKFPSTSIKVPSSLVLEKEIIIGNSKKGKEYSFPSIVAIRADQEGNVYVLDRTSRLVKKYDNIGRYLMTIGGPGEGFEGLNVPTGMDVIPCSGIFVFHSHLLSHFSFQGKHLKDIKAPKVIHNPQIDSQGNIIAGNYYYSSTMTKEGKTSGSTFTYELKKYDSDFTPYLILSKFDWSLPARSDSIDFFPRIIFFTISRNDEIVWQNDSQYKFFFTDKNGQITRIFQKEYEPIRISDGEKKKNVARMRIKNPNLQLRFPEYYPPIKSITSDNAGRIYVGTYEKYEMNLSSYDVFDASGHFIAKIVLSQEIGYWSDGHMYAIEFDADGNSAKIVRYKASWK